MSGPASSLPPLLELEARQDDLLRQLEELERRVERALVDFAALAGARQGPSTRNKIDAGASHPAFAAPAIVDPGAPIC